MKGLLARSLEFLKRDGVFFGVRRTARLLRLELARRYRNLRGGATVSIEGVDAQFRFRSVDEFLSFRYTIHEEREFLSSFLRELRDDDVVWDVGANIGIHTCLAGQVAERVVAFEPYPPNTARVETNVELNDSAAEVHEVALSDDDGRRELAVPAEPTPGDQWPSIVPGESGDLGATMEQRVVAGDTLIAEGAAPQPDVIKIDVEGASGIVLDGLTSVLGEGGCRCVFVEVHLESPVENSRPAVTDFGYDPDDVRCRLERLGFEVEQIGERRADFFLKATDEGDLEG